MNRKKKHRRKSKLFILVTVFLILVIAIFAFINFSPILFMKPTETGEISDTGIYSVMNRVNNMFFIKSDDGYIVIDAGSDSESVKESLEQISIDPLEVKYVLLTHSDYDHTGSLTLFPNAQIYIGKDELNMVDGSVKRNMFSKNSLPDGISSDSLNLIENNQELVFGGITVECIEMPGHTPGSIAYLIGSQYLFTGDAFKVNNKTLGIHPFTMDKNKSKESTRKIYESRNNYQYILTSHYGYYNSNELVLN